MLTAPPSPPHTPQVDMLERQLAALVAAAPRETVAAVAAAAAATHAAAASGGLPAALAAAAEDGAVDGPSRGSADSPAPQLEAVPMASTRVVVRKAEREREVQREGDRTPEGALHVPSHPSFRSSSCSL